MTANVTKAVAINSVDLLETADGLKSFTLDGENSEDSNLRVIYFYRLPEYPEHGIKVGMTTCRPGGNFWSAIKGRIQKQDGELALRQEDAFLYGKTREVVHWGVALNRHGESFQDYDIHEEISRKFSGRVGQIREWFLNIPVGQLVDVFEEFRRRKIDREIYKPRDEQKECIEALKEYFGEHPIGERFLLNCKMRFGKSYTTYKYCEEAGLDRVLILTFVPAVQDSWRGDLFHIEKRYQYLTDEDIQEDEFELDKVAGPFVLFLSLQNLLGKDKGQALKRKFRKLQGARFDLLVLDEYHFGAWNDRTQEVFEDIGEGYQKTLGRMSAERIVRELKIFPEKTICLSGTPFRALATGEFTRKNTFTYTYFEEQQRKYPPEHPHKVNADYERFPDMKIYGYNMSVLFPNLRETCQSKDKVLTKDYFSLKRFFETETASGSPSGVAFVRKKDIRIWLEILKGFSPHGRNYPYADSYMRTVNQHTLWLMPTVESCKAMADLLRSDDFFGRYRIINLSDDNVGSGKEALRFLEKEMDAVNPDGTKPLGTITITVNKLTLGVTVERWGGIFVLKDLKSPEQYFQAIFRVQNPFKLPDGEWRKCGYVYDFNIDRAAMLLLDFAKRSETSGNYEKLHFADLIVRYLPICLNGDPNHPISKDVFIQLAEYGDPSGKPLSRKITDTSRTTRVGDDETLAEMAQDLEVVGVIKKVFAHAKLDVSKKNEPPVADEESGSPEWRRGKDSGYELGVKDYEKYINFDSATTQAEFEKSVEDYVAFFCPEDYDDIQQRMFHNGFSEGYKDGVNAPIAKTQCGKKDGESFVKRIREEFGEDVVWTRETGYRLSNFVNKYLNQVENIPEECRGSLMRKWYCKSFIRAVRSKLTPRKEVAKEESTEGIKNVLHHILARLLQFLYISVYRETTFREIFENADPVVFLAGVGITKEEFSVLNRYHVFEEHTLNNYIKEFFFNESLGERVGEMEEGERDQYRNSFDWFGFGLRS